jgi:hypothetical protein
MKTAPSALPTALLALVFLAVYFLANQLGFPIRKDELHFWPSALVFSKSFVPSLESLRGYNDLNTPLPFLVFGWLEYFFSQGIWAGRLLNLILCFGIAWLFIPPTVDKRPLKRSIGALLGLMLCPYFFLSATHLYTEAIAIFFGLLGMSLHQRHHYFWAAICFVLAIASRQYLVAFPLSLVFFWIGNQIRKANTQPKAAILWPLVAAFSLVGWIVFFGGPAPRIALQSQVVSTTQAASLLPQNAGYFLACIGAYFCIPQLVLAPGFRRSLKASPFPSTLALLVGTALWFWLFPPLRNPDTYPFAQMGYLDKVIAAALGPAKVGVFYLLALLAVLRFRYWSVATCALAVHVPLMMKAHIAWDKYALPLLCFLWWQHSRGLELPTQNPNSPVAGQDY